VSAGQDNIAHNVFPHLYCSEWTKATPSLCHTHPQGQTVLQSLTIKIVVHFSHGNGVYCQTYMKACVLFLHYGPTPAYSFQWQTTENLVRNYNYLSNSTKQKPSWVPHIAQLVSRSSFVCGNRILFSVWTEVRRPWSLSRRINFVSFQLWHSVVW